MSSEQASFSLEKLEKKILANLLIFGPQKIEELIISLNKSEEEIKNAMELLKEKSVLFFDQDNLVYYPSLPLAKMNDFLDGNLQQLEQERTRQKENSVNFIKTNTESYQKITDTVNDSLNEYNKGTAQVINGIKEKSISTESDSFEGFNKQVSEIIDGSEQQTKNLNKSIREKIINQNTELLNRFQGLNTDINDYSGQIKENLTDSFSTFDEEINAIVKTTTKSIKNFHSNVSDVINEINQKIDEYLINLFEGSSKLSEEFEVRIKTDLNSSKEGVDQFLGQNKEKIHELLEKRVSDLTSKVIEQSTYEIDEIVSSGFTEVIRKTNSTITENSNRFLSEFNTFMSSSSELLNEQNTTLDRMESDIKKLEDKNRVMSVSDDIIKEIDKIVESNFKELEINFKQTENKFSNIFEILKRMGKQNVQIIIEDFNGIRKNFDTLIINQYKKREESNAKFLILSQSVEQLLKNLLTSIPKRAESFKSKLDKTIENSLSDMNKSLETNSKEVTTEIKNLLSRSQNQIDSLTADNIDTSTKIISSLNEKTDETTHRIIDLKESYQNRIKLRFEQSSKVMTTELDALSKNHQSFVDDVKSGMDNNSEILSSDIVKSINNTENSLVNSTSTIKTNLESSSSKEKLELSDLSSKVQKSYNDHLNRAMETIKEQFDDLRTSLKLETEKQVQNITKVSEVQKDQFIEQLNNFTGNTSTIFNEFKEDISKSVEENKSLVEKFITSTNESSQRLIEAYKQNISKYSEKGPTDILSFIADLEADVLSQQKNLKESINELSDQYQNFFDTTYNVVGNLFKEIENSNEKVINTMESISTISTKSFNEIDSDLETYFSDSLNDLNNQINITTEWVINDIEASMREFQYEIQIMKDELKRGNDSLNELIEETSNKHNQKVDQEVKEHQDDILSLLDVSIQKRQNIDKDLKIKLDEISKNFSNEIESSIHNIINDLKSTIAGVKGSITSTINNFDTVSKENTEATLNKVKTIFKIEEKDADVFGITGVKTKVDESNKKLRAALINSVQSEIKSLESITQEKLDSIDKEYITMERSMTDHIENLNSLFKESHSTVTGLIHSETRQKESELPYEEISDNIDNFVENLNNIKREVNKKITESIDIQCGFILEALDTSQEQSTNDLNSLISYLESLTNEFSNLLNSMNKSINDLYQDKSKNSLNLITDAYDNFQNTVTTLEIENKSKLNEMIQLRREDLENSTNTFISKTSSFYDHIINNLKDFSKFIELVSKEFSSNLQDHQIRFISIKSDESLNNLIKYLISQTKKDLFLLIDNPARLSSELLLSVTSAKKMHIITMKASSKKLEKLKEEISSKVNISTRISKIPFKGVIILKDKEITALIPEEIGIISEDPHFINSMDPIVQHFRKSSSVLSKKSLKKA